MSENPLTDKAEITAEGPGIEYILILFFMHSSIIILPGSDTVGVPASEISDTVLFDFKILMILPIFFFSLNLWLDIKFLLILYLERSFSFT